MKRLKMIRLLRDLRTIWHKQPFSVLRAKRTVQLLLRFITGKVFLLVVLVAAVAAAPPAYDLLTPAKVSNGLPATDIQILVVSIDPSICQPCARLAPVVDRLKSEGYNSMTVGPHPTPRKFPTVFIFRDHKLVDEISGYISEKKLKDRIHAHSTPK